MTPSTRRGLTASTAALLPISLAIGGGLFGTSAAAHLAGATIGACVGSSAIARVLRAQRNEQLGLVLGWVAFTATAGSIGSLLLWRLPTAGTLGDFALTGVVAGLAGGVAAAALEAAVCGTARMVRTLAAFLVASVLLLIGFRAALLLGLVLAAAAYGILTSRE